MSDIKITFLGTGTSVGVPAIGCYCKICKSKDSKNKRLRSSIYVKTEKIQFVVDTGPDFRTQCLRNKIDKLDAALFTHSHSDHIMGFDDLRRFTIGEDEMINIFATPSCLKSLTTSFPYVFDGKNKYGGYLKVSINEIKYQFRLGDLEAKPIAVNHGKVETIGFVFFKNKKSLFAYIPDIKSMSDESKNSIKSIPLLIIDGLQPQPHKTHLSIQEAVEISNEVKSKETWITHVSCKTDYKEEMKNLPKNTNIAWDGLKLCL